MSLIHTQIFAEIPLECFKSSVRNNKGSGELAGLKVTIVQHRALVLRSVQVKIPAALGRAPHGAPKPGGAAIATAPASHHGSPPRWASAATRTPATGGAHGRGPHRHRRPTLWNWHCDERAQRSGTCTQQRTAVDHSNVQLPPLPPHTNQPQSKHKAPGQRVQMLILLRHIVHNFVTWWRLQRRTWHISMAKIAR